MNNDQTYSIFDEINWWEVFTQFFGVFVQFWPVWVMFALIFVVMFLIKIAIPNEFRKFKSDLKFRKSKQWHSDRALLAYLRGMSPTEFEEYIASMFEALGYKAQAVGGSHDGGIDVVIEKEGEKSYVQCKKYMTKKVGVHEVRDFVGALADKLASGKGYFITTNIFTLDAKRYADGQPVELVDGSKLIEYVLLAQGKGWNPEVSTKAVNKCPKCSGELIKRKGKFGDFYGCSNYPKCKYTQTIEK